MRRSLRKKFRRQMLYGGLSQATYREIQPRVRCQNQRTFQEVLVLMLVAGLVLTLAAPHVPSMKPIQGVYRIFFALMLVLCAAARGLFRGKERYALILWYALLVLAFSFGIVLGTATVLIHDLPATAFCVLLFALPLLVVDAAWRMNLLIVGSTVVFCTCSYLLKSTRASMMDLVNAVTFCAISLLINTEISSNKMRQIADQMFIERERDTDGLTRLLTKSAAQMMIRTYLNRGILGALFVIDLDSFKQINDTYGHERGDQALTAVSRCLRQTFRHTDVLGRFGGDEFLVYMLAADTEGAQRLAREFLSSVKEQAVGDTHVTCSMGIAFPVDRDESYEELFARADRALYGIKDNGKNGYQIADPTLTWTNGSSGSEK